MEYKKGCVLEESSYKKGRVARPPPIAKSPTLKKARNNLINIFISSILGKENTKESSPYDK